MKIVYVKILRMQVGSTIRNSCIAYIKKELKFNTISFQLIELQKELQNKIKNIRKEIVNIKV